MNISLYIIVFSLALQLISVGLTFRLIVQQGNRKAGVIILLTIALMAFRRAIPLYRLIEGNDVKIDLFAEVVACAISFLLFLGIVFIGRLLSSLHMLRGLLPICYSCKRIRDEKGHWKHVEIYVEEHSEAQFSHGLCPDCGEKFNTEIVKFKKYRGHAQE